MPDHAFSRSQFPPGGWQFFQPQTGWAPPTPKSSTFDQTLQMIIDHRRKNPAICLRHNLSMDPMKVGDELEMFTRLRCGIPLPGPSVTATLIPGVTSAMIGTVSDIKKLAFGSGILVDWAESRQPAVPREEAERRAKICGDCPLNDTAKLEDWKKMPLAQMLKSRIVQLEGLRLSTASDAKLGLCQSLFSPNNMLVHSPIDILKKRIKTQYRETLDAKCWILSELKMTSV